MSLPEKCSQCPDPPVRTLGSQWFCEGCAESILEPIRQKVFHDYMSESLGVRVIGKAESDWYLQCTACGATWVGEADETCGWCADRLASVQEQRRQELLSPLWLRTDEGNPRYDHLSETDQKIWNRTRGQTREPQSIEAWAKQLAQAVREGLISGDEADRALSRSGS